MKRNILKAGALALIIGLSGTAFGNPYINKSNNSIADDKSEKLEVNVYPRENGLIAVNFKKELDETVEVKIYTLSGKRVFREKISTHELVAKKYDMTRLPDGEYIVEVSNDNYLTRKVVEKLN